MPRQNRVTPFGEIVATPARGLFMGNRGCLHDAGGSIRRAWRLRRWIICLLEFKGRARQVMAPGRYTELFFLDEATALAAGHRPCAECRRERFNAFRAQVLGRATPPSAVELDGQLHTQRAASGSVAHLRRADLDGLPDGTFVLLPDEPRVPRLVRGDGLLAWSANGYTARVPRTGGIVEVLTPALTVDVLRGGYTPELHPSAG